jgi:branched-chain amino acid transport system ATP-binding protein
MNAQPPRLSVSGLTKRFGGLVAVDSVSFDVAREGVTAVIGPNGAGKTTLFNMIAGAFAPTGGHVRFEGAEITGLPPEQIAARGLVRTFQLVQLFQNLSVVENVKVGRHLHTRGGVVAALLRPGWARREERQVEESARDLLEFVGLGALADTPASVLPYGQQRLLEIARALAAEPKLLLLDEPAAGLDREETTRLSGVIRKIAERGATVLLIEHDMTLVMNTADTVVVLDFGRTIARGTPEAVRTNPAVIEAYLGAADPTAAEPTNSAARAAP